MDAIARLQHLKPVSSDHTKAGSRQSTARDLRLPPISIPANPQVRRFKSIWISDLHMGTRPCKAEFLLDFFRYHESEKLYLLGDFVDGWRLPRSWYWSQSYNDIIQKILRKARKGTEVIYIPGNHDEGFRTFIGMQFGSIRVEREVIHTTPNGRRLLVIHGDPFDQVVKYARWLAYVGDQAYTLLMRLNDYHHGIRKRLNLPYWSLSRYVKTRVKRAIHYIERYEQACIDHARQQGLDGIVCGHIHFPACREEDGVIYANSGDWVEHCSALVEHQDGQLEVIRWPFVVPSAAKAPVLDAVNS